jgi:DNA-binding ferritin-like protein
MKRNKQEEIRMQTTLLENRRPATPTQQVRHVTPTERQSAIDKLARAVGEHALRQAEIDQRMATRLIELRDELSTAKDEIRSLHAQVETLIQGLSQGLALAHTQSSRVTQNALQASVASLRNR